MADAICLDGREVLAIVMGNQTRRLVFVSADDGAVRPFRTLDWNMGVPGHAEVSPDGRFVAYDRGAGASTDVFVVAADGTREEIPILEGPSGDRFLGWFPDGSAVLVSSNRGSHSSVYAVSVRDGQPHGRPVLVQDSFSGHTPYGFTDQGDFFYFRSAGGADVYIAAIDPVTGKVTEPPEPLGGVLQLGRSNPSWSPDGERIAVRGGGTPFSLGIYDLTSGGMLRVPLGSSLGYAEAINWMPDGRAFILRGRDLDAREGMFKVDPTTGSAESLGIEDTSLHGRVQVSPDSEWMFSRRLGGAISARHLKTGQTREVYRRDPWMIGFALSRDGRSIAVATGTDGPDGTLTLDVVSSTGGTARTLLRDRSSQLTWGVDGLDWSDDGRYVLLVKAGALWRIPANGDAPEELDVTLPALSGVAASPDGRRIALVVRGQGSAEIRALGNISALLAAR